jgi:hypothetical protein
MVPTVAILREGPGITLTKRSRRLHSFIFNVQSAFHQRFRGNPSIATTSSKPPDIRTLLTQRCWPNSLPDVIPPWATYPIGTRMLTLRCKVHPRCHGRVSCACLGLICQLVVDSYVFGCWWGVGLCQLPLVVSVQSLRFGHPVLFQSLPSLFLNRWRLLPRTASRRVEQ